MTTAVSTNRLDDPRACPICGLTGHRCFALADIWVSECVACRHRYAEFNPSPDHVALHYGDGYFNAGGAGYDNYIGEAKLLEAHGRRYASIVAPFCHPAGHLLSVGTAAGFVCNGFAREGWEVTGIEPNDSMAGHARRKLGLDVRSTTLEAYEPNVQYDLVTAIQVMAHFVAPQVAAQRMIRATRPGGYVLIETWNYRSLTARCFGRHWHEYSPPTVLHWFSRRSLDRLMTSFGTRRVATGRPKKRLLGSHARSLLNYKLRSIPGGSLLSAGTKLIPASMAIPYPSEDLFWSLYQVDS